MNLRSYLNILKLNDLFKDFSNEDILTLFNETNHKIKEYKKNSVVHFESEKCTTLDIILKGNVVVQRINEEGNILTITEFNAGNDIGGNLLFGENNTYPMSIISKTDTIFIHIDMNFVLELCQSSKNFLVEFLKCISEKAFILSSKINAITLKTLRESIIDFLNYEYYSKDTTKIKLNMSKKELAERLGVQRTSLSRELNKMRKDNLIEFDANYITIKDLSIIKK